MAAKPPRRTDPAHLGAHIVPVERALLHRADVLDAEARDLAEAGEISAGACDVKVEVAHQFRVLADELHHW